MSIRPTTALKPRNTSSISTKVRLEKLRRIGFTRFTVSRFLEFLCSLPYKFLVIISDVNFYLQIIIHALTLSNCYCVFSPSFSAASAGVAICCMIFIMFLLCLRRCEPLIWKTSNNAQDLEAFLEKYGPLAPKRYRYTDMKKITKNFHGKLGQGGFGAVFKGSLDDGHLVAVKILSDSKGNGEEFINEVASIGRTSHVNIVSHLGFCLEGSQRALIYELMSNGSLEKHIYSKILTTLGLEKFYQIAIGIAR